MWEAKRHSSFALATRYFSEWRQNKLFDHIQLIKFCQWSNLDFFSSSLFKAVEETENLSENWLDDFFEQSFDSRSKKLKQGVIRR